MIEKKYICDCCGNTIKENLHEYDIVLNVGYVGNTKPSINIKISAYQKEDIICLECIRKIIINGIDEKFEKNPTANNYYNIKGNNI